MDARRGSGVAGQRGRKSVIANSTCEHSGDLQWYPQHTAFAAPRPRCPAAPPTERLSLVVVGHVDHGKSTIIGRLLADTGSLPDGKLEQIRELCARTARPFEYAFLLDALKDERAQGITIDSARVFFTSAKRTYVIIDAPGHIEFLKNMVSGAARAEAAFLVIDAREGIQENTRRHGYLMGMLGIRQVAVLINKMDLVAHDERVYQSLVREFGRFLGQVGVTPAGFIPVSGAQGDNLTRRSAAMSWYRGPTALEMLDDFRPEPSAVEKPFRMPVQDVYKFTAQGDDRRIIAGTVESGRLAVGDTVVFHPSGKRSRVRSIEAFNGSAPRHTTAGSATGFTLDEQIYVSRGQIAAREGEPAPKAASRIAVSLFWLGKRPLVTGRDYILKLGSARVRARLESVERVIDASDLELTEQKPRVDRHDVADCILRLKTPVALDLVDELAGTSRFVLVDDYEISGGGIVRSVAGEPGGSTHRLAIAVGGSPESRARVRRGCRFMAVVAGGRGPSGLSPRGPARGRAACWPPPSCCWMRALPCSSVFPRTPMSR